MLGTNVFVIESLSLLVSQLHDLPGSICKSFVHIYVVLKSKHRSLSNWRIFRSTVNTNANLTPELDCASYRFNATKGIGVHSLRPHRANLGDKNRISRVHPRFLDRQ